MKKGGESGDVAINPELVTHVRSVSGPFVDVYFGDHRVAVEGTFRQVVERLSLEEQASPAHPRSANWLAGR